MGAQGSRLDFATSVLGAEAEFGGRSPRAWPQIGLRPRTSTPAPASKPEKRDTESQAEHGAPALGRNVQGPLLHSPERHNTHKAMCSRRRWGVACAHVSPEPLGSPARSLCAAPLRGPSVQSPHAPPPQSPSRRGCGLAPPTSWPPLCASFLAALRRPIPRRGAPSQVKDLRT